MIRTFIAFAVAPLVPVTVLVRDAGPIVAFVYSYLLTYLFGLPLFFYLRSKKKESHARYAFGGAGNPAAVAYEHPVPQTPNKAPEPTSLAVTPRADAVWNAKVSRVGARGAPARAVAHL